MHEGRRPDIASNIRSFPHDSYIIYYRYLEAPDHIEIARVFHGGGQQITSEVLS